MPLGIEHHQLPPAHTSQELDDVDETPHATLFQGRWMGLAPPEALDNEIAMTSLCRDRKGVGS